MSAATILAELRLALALEAAGLGTWTWDIAEGVTVWDVRLEELHGLPPGGFGGTFEDWVAALHPDDRAACLRRVERALADPGPYLLLHRTTWPDGSVHWIECRGRVVVDSEGVPTGTVGVAGDVTERERRHAQLAAEVAEKRDLVNSLQRALLPSNLPTVPGVTVAARHEASLSTVVGGDWYAVVPLPGDRLGIGIGDVAGHGLESVADMAAVRLTLRALAMGEADPAYVLGRVDEEVQRFQGHALITALYGVADPGAGTWVFANAGHCPAVIRRGGVARLVDAPAQAPLGLGTAFRGEQHPLPSGATLLLYTDGLVERRGEPLTVGFGRLLGAVDAGPDDPEALADHVLDAMLGDGANEDDVALVVAHIG
jgi:PAS domain S-box-containing protein